MNATLPMGTVMQTADEFAHAQSASTGLPERMCRANMKKNAFVLSEMRNILESLTRGLSFDVLATGQGRRARRPHQLPGAESRARSRAAVEFAGRARAVDADRPDADRTRAQARSTGAMDAVSHGLGICGSRDSESRDIDLSRWRRCGRSRARCVSAQRRVRRTADRGPLPRQPARAGAWPGLLEGSSLATIRSIAGSSIST